MDNGIRIKELTINNLKSIKYGKLVTNSSFLGVYISDIIGIYGQNGSGKSTIVDMFSILKNLVIGKILPKNEKMFITKESECIDLEVLFLAYNQYGEFFVKYNVQLISGQTNLIVKKESIKIRENELRHKFKNIISKDEAKVTIKNKLINGINIKRYNTILKENELSSKNSTSFVWSEKVLSNAKKSLNSVDLHIIDIIKSYFHKNLLILNCENQNQLLNSHLFSSSSMHLEYPCILDKTNLIPNEEYREIRDSLDKINIVLKILIPNLKLEVKEYGVEEITEGLIGTRFEIFTNRNDLVLPLSNESAGIVKIIQMTNLFIYTYNNPNSCVVIDDLDSNIFEYLIGDILEKINLNGKGQLFFTSHNLRPLQIIRNKKLWFITTNPENKLIQLKGVKELSNVRDMYLRAVQLNLQDEVLYDKSDNETLEDALKKAGQ